MVYSPSRTEAFDFCSLKGKLMYVDGWEPREAGNGTVGKIVGAAFAKGAESIHNATSDGTDIAAALYDRTVEHYIQHGVSFTADLGKVKDELVKTLKRYSNDHPFKQWTILATEKQLKDYGNCRLDVVGIDHEGYVAIADNKYKRTLNPDYLNKTVAEYRDSWQFLHYPWAYHQYIEDNNTYIGPPYKPATRMYLVLVSASPYRVLSYPFNVNLGLQKRWVASAQQAWADISAIEKGDRQPRMAAVHRTPYGQCEMYKACFEQDLNPDLMSFDYVKVPRLPSE